MHHYFFQFFLGSKLKEIDEKIEWVNIISSSDGRQATKGNIERFDGGYKIINASTYFV